MLQNSDQLTIHCFTRSLKFWGSAKASTLDQAVFPATAFNAMQSTQIYAGRLGPSNPVAYNLVKLGTLILASWQREYDYCSLQQLRWSLTNIPLQLHNQILAVYQQSNEEPMKSIQTTLPPDVVSKLIMSLASLEQSLLAKDPMMPQHLRASHQLLISYPETVHLLDDDEIARLISAAQIHTGIEIVKATAAKGGSRKKISADDL